MNNPNDALCDDGNASTTDVCDTVSDCINTPITNAMNQTIVLTEGWNLVNVWINSNATSEELGAPFVMYYDSEWVVDWGSITGDEFNITPLRGYLVYSPINTSVELSGVALPGGSRYEFTDSVWNLFGTQYASTFNVLYSDYVGSHFGIYQINEIAGGLDTAEIQGTDTLNPANVYWINLAGPELAPPSFGFFNILLEQLRELFMPRG